MIQPLMEMMGNDGQGVQGHRTLILRRKFTDLEKSLILTSHRLYRGRGRYDGQKKRWMFPNDCSVQFGHVQHLKDLNDYYSSEYQLIEFDEATQFVEEMYMFFWSRLRTTNPNIVCKFRAATNPGGVGHSFMKKRFWIGDRQSNQAYPVTSQIKQLNGELKDMTYHRAFIPATVYDNPLVVKNNPQYILQLMELPEDKRRALLDGDWEAYKGQFFKEFDKSVHVCRPFDVPANWRRSIAFDWGYNDPTCVLWFAEDPKTGLIYCYREYKVNETIDIDVAREIYDLSKNEEIYCIYYPWDLDFKDGQTGVSSKERMDDVWRKLGRSFYLKEANKKREQGWNAVRWLLARRSDGKPRMQIFDTCRYLIQSIPEQIYDETKSEDLDTLGDDHAVDGLRYFAATFRNLDVLKIETREPMPVDIGGAIRMPNGETRMKVQARSQVRFNWMVE